MLIGYCIVWSLIVTLRNEVQQPLHNRCRVYFTAASVRWNCQARTATTEVPLGQCRDADCYLDDHCLLRNTSTIVLHFACLSACSVVRQSFAFKLFHHRLGNVTQCPQLLDWYWYWVPRPMKISVDTRYCRYLQISPNTLYCNASIVRP